MYPGYVVRAIEKEIESVLFALMRGSLTGQG